MKNVMFMTVLLIGLLFVSCAKEVEEEQNPMNSCDTEEVSFQNDILPLFTSNCNACHSAAANLGGITLDNFDDAKVVVESGRLLGALNREDGFSPMPQSAAKLSDCSIDKVDAWISDGALNN